MVSGLKVAIKPPAEDNPHGYIKVQPIAGHRLYCLDILTLCRHCSMSSIRLVFLGALLLPTMLRAQANLPDVPEANRARPTVSTPATLTPVAICNLTTAACMRLSPEFSKRLGVNQAYKLTLDKRVELLSLLEPFKRSTGAAVSGNRPGEVFAGVQAVILPGKGERPTISAEYLRRLYASPALPPFLVAVGRQCVRTTHVLFPFRPDHTIPLRRGKVVTRRSQVCDSFVIRNLGARCQSARSANYSSGKYATVWRAAKGECTRAALCEVKNETDS